MKRLFLALVFLSGSACSADGDARVVVRVLPDNGARLEVHAEVADTPQERECGLMHREHLADAEGMVFLWPEPSRNVFWMKDTPLSLDILFIREGRIVAIAARAKPLDETPIDPGVTSDAVLEVRGGWAERHRVAVGDRVVVPR